MLSSRRQRHRSASIWCAILSSMFIVVISAAENNKLTSNTNNELASLGSRWIPPVSSKQIDIINDLSLNTSYQTSEHEYEWKYCKIGGDNMIPQTISYCKQTYDVENEYQQTWTGHQFRIPFFKRKIPHYMSCATLPTPDYIWPNKEYNQTIHWKNMRLSNQAEAIKQSRSTSHSGISWFDTALSDQSALNELSWAARFIPFGTKIRMMLDLGGDASLFYIVKHKYDVQTINTIMPDGPKCEFVSERGGLCMLIDMFEPMPFAKFTFDVIHVGSIYETLHPDMLIVTFNEVNRLIRPGGYLWMHSTWSKAQVESLRGMLITKLGYQVLYQQERPTAFPGHSGHIPHEIDWDIVLVKPIVAVKAKHCAKSLPTKYHHVVDTEKQSPHTRSKYPVVWID